MDARRANVAEGRRPARIWSGARVGGELRPTFDRAKRRLAGERAGPTFTSRACSRCHRGAAVEVFRVEIFSKCKR